MRKYQSKAELSERWRAGCEFGRKLAKEVDLHNLYNNSACNEDGIFMKPLKFKPFTSGFDEMCSEEELGSSDNITMDEKISK